MAAQPLHKIDNQSKAETLKDSVDRVLQNTDKASAQPSDAVTPVAQAVQGEVADVMAGVEVKKPSEKVGERGREKKPAASGFTPITGDGSTTQAQHDLKPVHLPTTEVMIKRIRQKIQADIKAELKQATQLTGKLKRGSAQAYNVRIAKVRKLKHMLHQLLTAAQDFIKDLYLRLFHANGKPREHSVL